VKVEWPIAVKTDDRSMQTAEAQEESDLASFFKFSRCVRRSADLALSIRAL
jgi:hypothetical protein